MLPIEVYHIVQAISHQCPIGNVFCDICTGSDKNPVANVAIANDFCSVAYENIVAYGWRAFAPVAANQHIRVNCAVFANNGTAVDNERSVMREMQPRTGL